MLGQDVEDAARPAAQRILDEGRAVDALGAVHRRHDDLQRLGKAPHGAVAGAHLRDLPAHAGSAEEAGLERRDQAGAQQR